MAGITINLDNIENNIYPKLDTINQILNDAYKTIPFMKLQNFEYETITKLTFIEAEIDDLTYDIASIKKGVENIVSTACLIEDKKYSAFNLNVKMQAGMPAVLEYSSHDMKTFSEDVVMENLIDNYEKEFRYNFFPSGFKKRIAQRDANIQACYNKYILGDKFNAYPEFKNCLIQDRYVSKPSRDTCFATQGVCEVKGTTFITSYDTGYDIDSNGKVREIKKNSKLEIVGEQGEIKTLYFNNTAHVGGIGYSEEREMFYISGSGVVNYYSLDYIASIPNGAEIIPEGSFKLEPKSENGNNAITKASYLTVNADEIWVGEFQYAKDYDAGCKPEVRRYETDDLGNMVEKELYELPYRNVQGMCIKQHNNQEYYIFSTSEGRTNDSYLKVCIIENGYFKEIHSLRMPCLSEQVSLTEDGNLMIVFESDCVKYGDAADGSDKKSTKQVGNVCYLDFEKVIE